MTTTLALTPARRLPTLLLVVVAGVAACETRMPAPVAPLANYVVTDGKAAPVAITEENRDSVRASLVEGVQLSLSQADTSTAPVLVVRDANGVAVYSGRMNGARDSILAGIPPDVIQSVEVIKGRAALPAGARAGMIVVRLKPGAPWRGLQQAPSVERPLEPLVSLIDAEGREVWSGRGLGPEVGGVTAFGGYRVLAADIARVEVFKGPKAPEGGLIQVHLKAGAKVAKP